MEQDIKKRLIAAYELLSEESTSLKKFENIRILIKGVNPNLDKRLDEASLLLSSFQKIQKGEIIELTAENIPEKTEGEKKRKKTLLLLIKVWKDLKNEVERLKIEFEKMKKKDQNKVESAEKIIAKAKGPFGIITITAILVIGVFLFVNSSKDKNPQNQVQTIPSTSKIKIIIFDDKKIPLSELVIGSGPDCDNHHYHAKDHTSAKTIDGSIVNDPGGCGFGKVKEVPVLEVDKKY